MVFASSLLEVDDDILGKICSFMGAIAVIRLSMTCNKFKVILVPSQYLGGAG